MVRLISRQRGSLAALKLTKLFGIDDFPAAKDSGKVLIIIIAELQRAKRASEAPWVRKIGNPSSRENLVMTFAHERANVRPHSGGGGGVSRDLPHRHPYGKLRNAIFPWRFFVEKSEKHLFLFAMSTNDQRG